VIVRESSGTTHIENRWLVALAVLAVFLVLTLLSGRVKTFPVWVPCTLMVAFFGSELALRFATVKTMWLRIEKFVTVTFVLVAGVALMVNLGYGASTNGAWFESAEQSYAPGIKHCGVGHESASLLPGLLEDGSRRSRSPSQPHRYKT